MNELTDKNYCILIRGGVKTYINEERFKALKNLLLLDNHPKFLQIEEEKIIALGEITAILPASEIEQIERIKLGERKCSCGRWIPRGKTCGYCE